jgi:MinD-like ATPase involved in chromosome partitioning or flagellar assembly
MARFISIISTASGTGRTTVALNLGMALHKLNQKVVVFDADFSKPNMLDHLNISNLPVTLEDVFNGNNHVFDTIYRHVSGLKIIPSMTMEDYTRLQYHLQDLLADYDFIIMDSPIDMTNLDEVLKNCNEAIIVHSPEYSSKMVFDASEILKKHKILNLGIVLNKSHVDSVDSMFNIPVIAKFQDHKNISKSYKLKHPVVHSHPISRPSREFVRLAKRLVV